jgi:hypothetical protein
MGVDDEGYAPSVPHICGGDYVFIRVCLECGKIQGNFPVKSEELYEGDPAEKAIELFWEHYGQTSRCFYLGRLRADHVVDLEGISVFDHLHRPKKFYAFLIEEALRSHRYALVDVKTCEVHEAEHPLPPSLDLDIEEIHFPYDSKDFEE